MRIMCCRGASGGQLLPAVDGGVGIIGGFRCFWSRDGPGEEAMMVEGCRVRVSGPLAGHVVGFGEDLSGRGYTVQVRDRNLRLLACVSRWMAERELSAEELT